MKRLLFIFFLFPLFALAQVRPNEFTEEVNPSNTNFEVYSQKGGVNRRASLLNLKKYFTPIVFGTVAYVPTPSGNSANRMEFVRDPNGAYWFIDKDGNAAQLGSGSGAEISDFISTGAGNPPAAAASANGGKTWRNMTTGELWRSNGTSWIAFISPVSVGSGLTGNGTAASPLDWAGAYIAGPLTGGGTPLAPLNILNNSINDTYITQGSVDSTECGVRAISPNNLSQYGASNGEVLKWDGTRWKPGPDVFASGNITGYPIIGDGTNDPIEIIPGGPGDILFYDGVSWDVYPPNMSNRISGNGTTQPLDIAQQGATSGQVLKWNGSAWAPGTDNTGGGGGGTGMDTLTSYTALRAYTGAANSVFVRSFNKTVSSTVFQVEGGIFRRAPTGTENGGFTIISANGVVWARVWDGINIQPEWWEPGGTTAAGTIPATNNIAFIDTEGDRIRQAALAMAEVSGAYSTTTRNLVLKNGKEYLADHAIDVPIGTRLIGNNSIIKRVQNAYATTTESTSGKTGTTFTLNVSSTASFKVGMPVRLYTPTGNQASNHWFLNASHIVTAISGNTLTLTGDNVTGRPTMPVGSRVFSYGTLLGVQVNTAFPDGKISIDGVVLDGGYDSNTGNTQGNNISLLDTSYPLFTFSGATYKNAILENCVFRNTAGDACVVGREVTFKECVWENIVGSCVHGSTAQYEPAFGDPDGKGPLDFDYLNITNCRAKNVCVATAAQNGHGWPSFYQQSLLLGAPINMNGLIIDGLNNGVLIWAAAGTDFVNLTNVIVVGGASIWGNVSLTTVRGLKMQNCEFYGTGTFGGCLPSSGETIEGATISGCKFYNTNANVRLSNSSVTNNYWIFDKDNAAYRIKWFAQAVSGANQSSFVASYDTTVGVLLSGKNLNFNNNTLINKNFTQLLTGVKIQNSSSDAGNDLYKSVNDNRIVGFANGIIHAFNTNQGKVDIRNNIIDNDSIVTGILSLDNQQVVGNSIRNIKFNGVGVINYGGEVSDNIVFGHPNGKGIQIIGGGSATVKDNLTNGLLDLGESSTTANYSHNRRILPSGVVEVDMLEDKFKFSGSSGQILTIDGNGYAVPATLQDFASTSEQIVFGTGTSRSSNGNLKTKYGSAGELSIGGSAYTGFLNTPQSQFIPTAALGNTSLFSYSDASNGLLFNAKMIGGGFQYMANGSAAAIRSDNTNITMEFAGAGTANAGASLTPNFTFKNSGILNVLTGYQIGNAATLGNVLRGDGNRFVSAKLLPSDLAQQSATTGQVLAWNGTNWNPTAATSPDFWQDMSGAAPNGTNDFTKNIKHDGDIYARRIVAMDFASEPAGNTGSTVMPGFPATDAVPFSAHGGTGFDNFVGMALLPQSTGAQGLWTGGNNTTMSPSTGGMEIRVISQKVAGSQYTAPSIGDVPFRFGVVTSTSQSIPSSTYSNAQSETTPLFWTECVARPSNTDGWFATSFACNSTGTNNSMNLAGQGVMTSLVLHPDGRIRLPQYNQSSPQDTQIALKYLALQQYGATGRTIIKDIPVMREEVFVVSGSSQTTFTLLESFQSPSGSNVPLRVFRNGLRLRYVPGTPADCSEFTYSGDEVTTCETPSGDIIIVEYIK